MCHRPCKGMGMGGAVQCITGYAVKWVIGSAVKCITSPSMEWVMGCAVGHGWCCGMRHRSYSGMGHWGGH